MNTRDILGTKLLINIIFAYAILHHTVAKRVCINGECKSDSADDCYQNQCYEILGDCNEENQCENDNSICVRTKNNTNICVWLKLREGDATASSTDATASSTDATASSTDATASTTDATASSTGATASSTDATASTTATSYTTDITTVPTTIATSLITDITIPTTTTITTSHITMPSITTPHDKCRDKISTCLRYYFLCNNDLYKELMKSFCYLTCGYCNKPILTTITPDICQDKAAPGKPSDCPLHYDLCYNSVYAEFMKDQCPETCGFCNVQH